MIILRFFTSLFFSVAMIILTMFYGFTCSCFFKFPAIARRLSRQYGYLVAQAAKYLCGIRYEIRGAENVPKDNRFIIFCKHQSTWETLFLLYYFPELCIILKKELLSIPFFGWGLKSLRPIAIDRSTGRTALVTLSQQGEQRLQQGLCILCFPEGTRKMPGEAPDYKVGGAVLATKTGAPVLPMAVNSGKCWPKGAFLKKPGLITVVIGPCIDSEHKKSSFLLQEIQHWIENHLP